MFPKTYSSCNHEVYEDNVVVIEGRMSIDERETKINASRLYHLPLAGRDVRIRIAPYLENALVQRQLGKAFATYRGEDVVYLHLLQSHRIIKTNPEFWVDSTNPGFRQTMEKLLGKDCWVEE